MLDLLNSLFRSISPLWEMSATAAYAAAVVIVLRLLLKKRAPRQVLCLLWLVVFARLLIPVSLESPLSIVPNALPGQEYAVEQAPAGSGAGDPAAPIAPQDPVQDQPQNQPGNDTATPAAGGQNPSLSVPEGVGPAAPAPETPAAFPWQAVIAGVWLTGAAAMGGCALVSYLRMRRRLFDAIRAEDGVWEHPAVNSPFILGVLRPRIYLPAGLTGQPRQFILCHERAHLRRFDHLVKPVCWIALALHWFNPLAWAAFLLMSRDIEAACDEAVLRQLGSTVKADYSDTLLALAAGRRFPAPCPLAFDEGDAKGRIRNVLSYRRPAFWAVVISVIAAALATVCLLTDPVAAKESEGDPDPDATTSYNPDATGSFDPDVSNSQDVEGLNSLLDPWMKEILDGERTFTGAHDDRAYSINDLKLFCFGDARAYTTLGFELTILDLDRDGVNELMLSPIVDNNYLSSDLGYLIFRRVGDEIYGYTPGYRSFEHFKADGTFEHSSNAADWGIAFARFSEGGLEADYITWRQFTGLGEELYFVDGRKATREEFYTAVSAQDAKPEPDWYVYRDGALFAADRPDPIPPITVQPDVPTLPSEDVYAIDVAAPLDAPIVDPYDIPEDPSQWYKVAELPDDMIRMYSRDHGAETLLRWNGNLYKEFGHTAHTSLGIMPQLKKLSDDPNFFGSLAVISNVDKGTGMYIEELVVYDLDAADPMMDHTHDWTSLREDFNENVFWQYDKNTRTLTYTYQGQTVKAVIDANDEARLVIEHDYPGGIEQEDIRLCITGEFVYYRFDQANDGDIRVELTVELFVGYDVVPLIIPGWVGWTLRFNGSGFDTVPGSCMLGYPGYGV